ncbi:MAG: hypothetical protein AAGF85_20655 [Bacteroidota bacterium]
MKGNSAVRKISADGIVTALAGEAVNQGSLNGIGTNALFNYPIGITVNDENELFIVDQLANSVRKLSSGNLVSTITGGRSVGSIDGPGSQAQFRFPAGCALDKDGDLYVTDFSNNTIER